MKPGCGGAQGGCLSGEETPWTGLGSEELAEVAWGEEYLGLPAEAVTPCGPKLAQRLEDDECVRRRWQLSERDRVNKK